MAIWYDAPVAPDALSAFVREVPIPSQLALLQLFPIETQGSNTYDFAEVLRTNRTARFRSFDGRVHVSERDGGSEKRVRFPALSDSLSQGEYERLQEHFAQTGGTRTEALSNAIYNDAEILTRHVLNRLEQAVGDVLSDGKLTIDENDYKGEADYGIPAQNLPTPGVAWSDVDAPILDDLQAWVDQYQSANGFLPGSILTSTRVRRLLSRNKQIIAAAAGSLTGRSQLLRGELETVLQDLDLPWSITTYDTRVDVDGVSTRVIEEEKFIFLPPNPADAVRVKLGVSATALELVNDQRSDLTFEQAPGIVGVVDKSSGVPYRKFTYVDAVGMPVMPDAKTVLSAEVL